MCSGGQSGREGHNPQLRIRRSPPRDIHCHKLNKNNVLAVPQSTNILALNPKFKINSSKCICAYLSAEHISGLVSNQGSSAKSITLRYKQSGVHNIVINKNQKYFLNNLLVNKGSRMGCERVPILEIQHSHLIS